MLSKITKIFVMACLLLFTSLSYAQSFNKIVVFGDSLSDNGNFFTQTEGTFPPAPYYQGRFSNGPVWVEILANQLKLDVSNKTQFTDYAFALAWAADTMDGGSGGLVSLSWEITKYLEEDPMHGENTKDTLFVFWIGNNDYLKDRSSENDHTIVSNAINFTQLGLHRLMNDGAKHFLILNLPDLGKTPAAKQIGDEFATHLTQLSAMHNHMLSQLIAEEKAAHPDVQFIEFDLSAYFNDLLNHPEKYNIYNVSKPCYPHGLGGSNNIFNKMTTFKINGKNIELQNNAALANMRRLTSNDNAQPDYTCGNAAAYFLFWDYVHPTARAHELIAEFVRELLFKEDRWDQPSRH